MHIIIQQRKQQQRVVGSSGSSIVSVVSDMEPTRARHIAANSV